MNASEDFRVISCIFNVIKINPSLFYDSSRRMFKGDECKILLKRIIPYLGLVLINNQHDFIYLLIAWVYKTLEIPYLKIDNNEFYLLKVHEEYGRNKLQILSVPSNVNELNTFYVYTSKSSGSTWRYCEYDSDSHINKGYDYISNTFIHIKLQMYIDDNFSKIPKKIAFHDYLILLLNKGTFTEEQLLKKLLPYLPIQCKKTDMSEKNREKRENIYGTERIVPDDVFRPMRKLLSSAHSFKSSISEQYLVILNNLNELRSNAMNSLTTGSPGTNRYTHRIMQILNPILTNREFSNKIQEAARRSSTGRLSTADFKLYLEILHKCVDIYNSYLKNYFTVETKSDGTHEVYTYSDYSKNPIDLNGWKISFSNIEFKKLIRKDDGKKFRIIYQPYRIVTSPNYKFNGNYKIIIGFISDDPKINKYGLYTKFISSGFYVYKMFDYDSQVGSLVEDSDRLAENYVFIGDIMNKFYPL